MSELYLGRTVEGAGLNGKYLHRLADLVTHTFVCGASGSGKTVIGKAIIEEASLRGVPAIIIDLKGDLSSIGLAFPELSAAMVAPWIQVDASVSLGRAALAAANTTRSRLLQWGLTEADVRKFHEDVAVEVFTPRSDRGRRLALPLIPTAPPDIDRMFDEDPDTALAMVSGLAESLVRRVIPSGQRDREQEYMTALIEHSWRTGDDLTGSNGLTRLVGLILDPPFERIGALTVCDHLPDARRQKLAQAVNGQLVGAESGWLRGEELDIDSLTGANRTDGKTQVSVINLSAVTNFEDQSFVVAQIAFAINAWMRRQGTAPGGDRPRLLFFIDEIGGGGGKTAFYPSFPYTSTAKPALNLLVKQGRAFGVGCLLATQNPGDIDYKGLSNCSTWIIGKLQTKRDRDKVREGLADAEITPNDLAKRLATPGTGQFMFMTSDGCVSFVQERWLLSYHCTLTLDQIHRFKTRGLTPHVGELDTVIELASATDESSEVDVLWRQFHNSLGESVRHLEAILAIDGGDTRARAILNVIRDPVSFQAQLSAAQRDVAARVASASQGTSTRGLMDLLASKPPVASNVPEKKSHCSPPTTTPLAEPTIEDSQKVTADGRVHFKGKSYMLYRRYAGKAVSIIVEADILKFSVDGKILSKTYPRPHE